MRNIRGWVMVGAMLTTLAVQAQNITKTRMAIPRAGEAVVRDQTVDYAPILQNFEMPQPGTDRYRMEQLKAQIKAQPPQQSQHHARAAASVTAPALMRNFGGNSYAGSIPNDNDMAISNDGILMSCINTNIWMWDVDDDTLLYQASLETFSSILNIPNAKFDPRVMYDPEADRFIVTFLRGFTDSTSYIILGFSQTNDPTGAWNFYSLPGNPFGTLEWTDYPMIAITKDEFVVTGNLLGTGEPWETGFKQTLIWQIRKRDGYNGDTLTTQLWSGINYGGQPIRNLRPVKGGAGLHGPNLYFLSNRNFTGVNDSIFIVELTDTIGGNDTLLIDVRRSNTPYGFPPNGDQQYNLWLNTNDCRILSAYIENDRIHFAGNTNDFATSRPAVYHGTIDLLNNMAVTATVIGDSILDYGYPNLAYTGNGPGDDQCIILLNYTADQHWAGMTSIYFDGTGYSPTTLVKAGDNFINPPGFGSPMRWGDYSGAQRRYNIPGTIWVSGTYGRADRRHATWIAELGNPNFVAQQQPAPQATGLMAYPNPTQDRVSVEFTLDKSQNLDISLYDAQGKLVKVFIRDKVKQGRNEFSISTQDLSPGIYFLQLKGDQGMVASKKIIRNGN